MHNDFLEASVFHMEGVVTSDKQIKRIQMPWSSHYTEWIDTEINEAVYTIKKNLIAILDHSIQAGDSAKQHRFCPPDKNSWFEWQQEC